MIDDPGACLHQSLKGDQAGNPEAVFGRGEDPNGLGQESILNGVAPHSLVRTEKLKQVKTFASISF
jgi:hypothetical protein